MLLLMWRKDKYYVLHGMTLNWWFTHVHLGGAVQDSGETYVARLVCGVR